MNLQYKGAKADEEAQNVYLRERRFYPNLFHFFMTYAVRFNIILFGNKNCLSQNIDKYVFICINILV